MPRKGTKRIVIYPRKEDLWIYEELERIIETKKAMGFDTDITFEVTRLLKQSISGDFDKQMQVAKLLGLFETWKEETNGSH